VEWVMQQTLGQLLGVYFEGTRPRRKYNSIWEAAEDARRKRDGD
jgi:hypothetical protein